MAIKKEVNTYKIALNTFIYRDNKNKVILDILELSKNKDRLCLQTYLF